MSEAETQEPGELEDPTVADVPEPDQEAEKEEAEERLLEPHEREEEPEPGEPEAALLPEAQVDEKSIEKAAKSLAKHATTNANRISAIMGEDAQHLEPCPRCMGGDPSMPKTPGFIWPPGMVPLLPEHKAAVKLSIGEGVEPDYRDADDAQQCSKCGGRGKVQTGSFVQGQERLPCLDCNGRGWIGPRQHRETTVPSNNVPELVTAGVGAVEAPPESDPWGRLRDDPLYGVMPGFERD